MMQTKIEIKNKYKLSFAEALLLMQQNQVTEVEVGIARYRFADGKLQTLIGNEWQSTDMFSINKMLEYTFYPVYPEGFADWARVQLEKGLIIQDISYYSPIRRLVGDEFQYRDLHADWCKSRFSLDYYFNENQHDKFIVTQDFQPVKEPEPVPEPIQNTTHSASGVYCKNIDGNSFPLEQFLSKKLPRVNQGGRVYQASNLISDYFWYISIEHLKINDAADIKLLRLARLMTRLDTCKDPIGRLKKIDELVRSW